MSFPLAQTHAPSAVQRYCRFQALCCALLHFCVLFSKLTSLAQPGNLAIPLKLSSSGLHGKCPSLQVPLQDCCANIHRVQDEADVLTLRDVLCATLDASCRGQSWRAIVKKTHHNDRMTSQCMQVRKQEQEAAASEAANALQSAELQGQHKALEEKQHELEQLQASLWAKVRAPPSLCMSPKGHMHFVILINCDVQSMRGRRALTHPSL